MYRALLIAAALGTLLATGAQAVTTTDLVNQVSTTSLQNYLQSLPTYYGDNRCFNYSIVGNTYVNGAQHDIMRDKLFTYFRQSGWTTFYDPIYITDTSGNISSGANIIAVKQGSVTPDKIYFVSGHYDSTANHQTGFTSCPGADDNASGCVGLLEMARIFSKYTFDSTIIFACFDGEEQTINGNDGVTYRRVGSIHYVNKYTDIIPKIQTMVSFDMVAWANGSNRGRLESGYSQNTALDTAIENALTNYGGLSYSYNNSQNYSDHVSFANKGIPALMLIEYNWTSDPYYHTTSDAVDNPSNIGWAYYTKMVKAICGYVSDAAHLNGVAAGYAMAPQSSGTLTAQATNDLGAYLRGLVK